MWNVHTDCSRTLVGHSDSVWSLQLVANNKLASGSEDKSIKIWNVETGVCIRTLTGHRETIYSLHLLSNNRLASETCDKAIKLWNVDTGR